RLHRGDRALSRYLAHRRAADDRHDAARRRPARVHRSHQRRVRAHGSAPVSQSLMQALARTLPQAVVTNAYGTTEAGPVVFGPHPNGLPQPEMSVGYPHPHVQLRLVEGDDRDGVQGVLEMKCPAMMNGYHNRPDVTPPFTADG